VTPVPGASSPRASTVEAPTQGAPDQRSPDQGTPDRPSTDTAAVGPPRDDRTADAPAAVSAGELSSPERPARRHLPRVWAHRRLPGVPLRVTLVALLMVLVTVALAATGAVATSELRKYVIQQQDAQLRDYAQDMRVDPRSTVLSCASGGFQFRGSYVACIPATGPIKRFASPRTPKASLPDTTVVTAAAVARTDETFTLPAADGSTSWRLVATQVSDRLIVVVGADLADDEAVLGRLVTIEVVVGLVVLAILGIAGYLLVRNSLRPLVEVEHTAQAIAAGDLSRRVPEGDERTEVGRLSNAINGMLGRIESSFRAQQASEEQARASEEQALASEARMRRFVADASHELRTPLTSIRGFAELHRQGAVAGPEETERIMERIEAEATRMGVLVEDLLQLARLDQQRPLTLAPVDLAELAGDAVHDARAVQPDRSIALNLDPSLTDVPVVIGDEARLRQVVVNLVTNALTHTPATARITVRLSEDPTDHGTVVLSVADQGPGLAPADAQRVFERFYRADTSRTRAAGGSGLGLSIVAALVAAHGGRVDLTTAPGKGATFTVRLPRSGPSPAAAPADPPG
jgi:two-component system, OmpR family, sensor kinase